MNFIENDIYYKDLKAILDNRFPWQRLDGKNVLVTGSNGMIGSVLTDLLMVNPERNYQVYICGRNEQAARQRFSKWWNDPCFHFFKQDLTDEINNTDCFHYIFHTAGYSYPKAFSEDPVGTVKGTVWGTDNLIRYGISHSMERMLFVSTGEIYGDGDSEFWKEDESGYVNPLLSRSCYPAAKRTAENLCISYCDQYGCDIVIARPSHVFGATFSDKDNRAYAQFIRDAVSGKDIVLKSDGLQKRGYCYVADCVSAFLYILFYGEKAQAYNVADDNSFISIREMAEILADCSGTKVIFQKPDDAEKKGYSTLNSTRLDSGKLRSLGWAPKDHAHSGFQKVISILKQ